MLFRCLFVFALSVTLTAPVLSQTVPTPTAESACKAGQSPLMILGMYHMANPGLDAINTEADDVLAPKRQQEIQALVNNLQKFRPTKIGLEAPYRSTTIQDRYKRYLEGNYALTHNETDQIGFRLAKQLGLPAVTPIDFQMFMNGAVNTELDLQPAPKPASSKPAAPAKPRELSADEKFLRAVSVSEYLRYINSDSMTTRNHSVYIDMLKMRKAPLVYENTDMVTNWYKRNLRMFTNLNREVEHGKDRVLILVGSGHVTILRQLAEASSFYCVVNPQPYL